MLCESNIGYLLKFIVYVCANTTYPNAPANLPQPFQEYTSPSKVVLSLLHQNLSKGYCVTLGNYYKSPELAKPLLLNQTGCFDTLQKKANIPRDFWLWKPKHGDPHKAKFRYCSNAVQRYHKSKNGQVCFSDVYHPFM